jgi:hypothetical protein
MTTRHHQTPLYEDSSSDDVETIRRPPTLACGPEFHWKKVIELGNLLEGSGFILVADTDAHGSSYVAMVLNQESALERAAREMYKSIDLVKDLMKYGVFNQATEEVYPNYTIRAAVGIIKTNGLPVNGVTVTLRTEIERRRTETEQGDPENVNRITHIISSFTDNVTTKGASQNSRLTCCAVLDRANNPNEARWRVIELDGREMEPHNVQFCTSGGVKNTYGKTFISCRSTVDKIGFRTILADTQELLFTAERCLNTVQ